MADQGTFHQTDTRPQPHTLRRRELNGTEKDGETDSRSRDSAVPPDPKGALLFCFFFPFVVGGGKLFPFPPLFCSLLFSCPAGRDDGDVVRALVQCSVASPPEQREEDARRATTPPGARTASFLSRTYDGMKRLIKRSVCGLEMTISHSVFTGLLSTEAHTTALSDTFNASSEAAIQSETLPPDIDHPHTHTHTAVGECDLSSAPTAVQYLLSIVDSTLTYITYTWGTLSLSLSLSFINSQEELGQHFNAAHHEFIKAIC